MTLKDVLRVLRRRGISALLLFTLGIAGFTLYARSEKPSFRAHARVSLSMPPALVQAARQAPWISLTPADPATWISMLSGRRMREAAPGRPLTLAVEGGAALRLESVAATPEAAAEAANTFAAAALVEGADRAGRERAEAVAQARERRRRESDAQAARERAARVERETARGKHAAEDLELELRKIGEDLPFHESRRKDLDRRLAANRLRLERIRADRRVAEHLRRDVLPRAVPGTVPARQDEHPEVARAVDRIESLHRKHVALLRERPADDPAALDVRAELREAELDLSRARAAASGRDMDREDLAVRTDDELAGIEIRVLEPEIRALRERAAALAPFLERARAAATKAVEAAARGEALDALLAQLESAPGSYVQLGDSARPEDAVRAEARVGTSTSWALALLLSALAALLLAFALEAVDTSLRTDYDVLRHLAWPTLGVVPRTRRNRQLVLFPEAATAGTADVFDTLATVLLSVPGEHPSKAFLLTSANPAEGKTTSSINLAAALARQGKRTLLVDGDFRKPALHACFGLERGEGFAGLLAGRAMPGNEGVFNDTQLPGLSLLTAGAGGDNVYELFDPARLIPVMRQLREMFDAIVVDSPPVLAAADALKLSSAVDAVLFAVEAGRTDVRQATWAKRLLAGVHARIAGVLLNRAGAPMTYYRYDEQDGNRRRKLVRSAV